MTFSLVGSSVQPSGVVTTYNVNTAHKKNETLATAIDIGNLDEESSTVSISDAGSVANNAVSTTFTALNGTASLTQAFSNPVDKAATQFQLFDSQGNIIADSQGTTAQQAAYAEWQAGSLNITAGTYTAIATPFAGFGTALTISKQEQQGTSLEVSSSLTGSDPTEYYNFSFSGSNLKLDFDTQSGGASPRVQILDSSGDVVADNEGNAFTQANYQALTSGTGLNTVSGNYTVEVSYPANQTATTTPTVPYNFQLYAGNSYAVAYNTTVTTPATDNTATGSVTAASNAQLYTVSQYNKINAAATTAVNIGWLQENKSALDVYSQLTSVDSADFYSLTLQQGNNLKFGFNTKTTTDPSALRVQLYNSTGTQIIADSAGTPAQQAAYKALTTTNGLTAGAGNYLVKISYAANAPKTAQTYEFGIYSGTGYNALYKTTASPQTIANAITAGTYGGGTSRSSAIASYLTAEANSDTDTSLSTALQAFI